MSSALPSLASLIDLTGRVAVITGGAAGIGRAISQRLAEAGARVVIADIAEAESVVAELRERGGIAESAHLDVTRENDHLELVRRIVRHEGRLDIWVNNAGVYPVDSALDMEAARWRYVMQTNVDGAFFGARAAGRAMIRAGRGVILNIASTSAFRVSSDGVSHYATSKWALRGLTQALAREFGPRGVRVVGIAPVFTRTDQALRALVDPDEPDLQAAEMLVAERYRSRVPLRRIAEPDDIARVALFAVSDLAAYITGSVLPVDGGFLAVS